MQYFFVIFDDRGTQPTIKCSFCGYIKIDLCSVSSIDVPLVMYVRAISRKHHET